MDYGLGYGFTVFTFISSFLIFPLFFLFRRGGKARKLLLGVQIGFFIYWNVICWGSFLSPGPSVFDSSLYPSTSDPEGSISLSYIFVTPVWAAFIVIELINVLRAARRKKQAPSEDNLLHLT